jgi:hypothetical protein
MWFSVVLSGVAVCFAQDRSDKVKEDGSCACRHSVDVPGVTDAVERGRVSFGGTALADQGERAAPLLHAKK